MPRYLFVVHSNAVEGREQECNDWYTNQHFPDVLACPGVVSARRFSLADLQVIDQPQVFKYLAIYEIEADDPRGFIGELMSRAGTESMPMSVAFAGEPSAVIWKAL